jgi:hypothetical protein
MIKIDIPGSGTINAEYLVLDFNGTIAIDGRFIDGVIGQLVQVSENLMVKLAEDRFVLAVLEQFKRGKSSLMNSIIARELLPTGVLPLTSAITVLKYGPEERLIVNRKDSIFPDELSISYFSEYVTETGNPGNQKKVITASIEVIKFVEETIRTQIGPDAVKIFPLSARLGLAARVSNDTVLYEQSGLKNFEEFLAYFLSGEKMSVFLSAIAQKTLRILNDEAAQDSFGEIALKSRIKAIQEEKSATFHSDPHCRGPQSLHTLGGRQGYINHNRILK